MPSIYNIICDMTRSYSGIQSLIVKQPSIVDRPDSEDTVGYSMLEKRLDAWTTSDH